MFPSGNTTEIISVGGEDVRVTICDVANWCVFAKASDFGITGYESAAELTANEAWVDACQELRGKVGKYLGLTKDWREWDQVTAFAPLPIFVAPAKRGHIEARLFLDRMCHESMAGTGAICTTACSRIPDTIVSSVNGEVAKETTFEISHPVGFMSTLVQTENAGITDNLPHFQTLSFVRTARRIMDGTVYVPKGP
jgi:2-methylaconitate cis-trans-isomerase PrpF